MTSTLQVWLMPVLAALAILVSPAAAQSKIVNDLAYALPLPLVTIIIIIIGIVIFCVMRRARYGYFCCMKPRVIYLPDSPSSENSDGGEGAESGEANQNNTEEETSLQVPGYSAHPNSTIAPPDYQDALQDVLVVRSDDPAQPPVYTSSDGNENDNTGESNDPESSEAVEQQLQANDDREAEPRSQHQQPQDLEDVDLDDTDSTENCDDTTPLNP